ncbi:hypothetical protein SAMN04488136_101259 [Vibrio xiamenensis]|uniref:Uncharacterized protein n=1 Tax=Vibrio xiamenensis TaxID=861298 RepID=A0A1G7W939_9VIBR|nr:hypothetical protein [Vibrio xiamenensis]SDG68359.1 hypothetical protein SAMN04488136_101259 [Vibrio xiamenensis]
MRTRRVQAKRLYKTVSANRRKRKLANNKKKIIWRHRAFMQLLA